VSPQELEKYLHDHIPLSKAMEASVISVDKDEVLLSAPLAPNINHRETVFGGSASTLAILAAWSLLHTRMRREGINCRLVIQRNTMDYDKPILGEFTARSSLARPQEWSRFIRMLDRRGKARVSVTAVLEHAGSAVGTLTGEFVALSMNES
jgi:thioesterase domain-containing protein